MISLAKEVAELMVEAAINELHTPGLYGNFLKAIIEAKTRSRSSGEVTPKAEGEVGGGMDMDDDDDDNDDDDDDERRYGGSSSTTPRNSNNITMPTPTATPTPLSFLPLGGYQGEMGVDLPGVLPPPPPGPPLSGSGGGGTFGEEGGQTGEGYGEGMHPFTSGGVGGGGGGGVGGGMTMEDVFSSVFWDSMVVPGTFPFFLCVKTFDI